MTETAKQTDTMNEKESESYVFDVSEFDDILKKAGRAFENGDLETAEFHVASALKLVYHEGKEIKRMKKCFKKLGDIYLEYGKKSKNGEDFAKATALYNSALCRMQNNETQQKERMISRIKNTEKQFLISILSEDSKIDVPGYEIDLQHRVSLEEIRRYCEEVICKIDANPDLHIKALESEKRVASETERTDLIWTLFREICDEMSKVVRALLDECISVLGRPPCRYAVIGLGSLARQEMTPYSDLEFAILIEEGSSTEGNMSYFRNLTNYLHIKVINLGETILPSMGIVSLNDFSSTDESRRWFYDDGPKGFCFDGAMPWATKMPLGRKKTANKDALELIRTPAEMAALQFERFALKEGYHLADVLASSGLIAGDEELFRIYQGKVDENLQIPSDSGDSWTSGSRRAFFSLHDAFRDFCVNLDWNELGKVFNVKKELYRFPSLVVSSLSLYYNLNTCVTWEAVEEMHEKKLISEQAAHNLQFALALVSELRLRSYLAKDSQRERVTTLMSDSDMVQPDVTKTLTGQQNESKMNKVFHFHDNEIIARLLMTVLPLQDAMRELLLKEIPPRHGKLLTENNLYDDRAEITASIYMRLLDMEKAKSCLEVAISEIEKETSNGTFTGDPGFFEKLSKLGRVYSQLGNEQNALYYYEKAARFLEAKYDGEIVANLEFAESFSDRGRVYSLIGEHEKALEFLHRSLSTKLMIYGENSPAIDVVSSLQGIASAHIVKGDILQGRVFYEKAMEMINEIGKTRVPTYYCTTLNSLVPLYTLQGDIQKASEKYDELFRTLSALYGTGVVHPYLASSLSNLALAHHGAGDSEKAATLYEHALSIQRQVYDHTDAHPEIAGLLSNLGYMHMHLSDHVKAIEYFRETLEMQRLLYRQQISHPELAMTLRNLGKAYQRNRDLSEAKEAYDEALKMLRLIHKDDFANRDLCKVLLNLGYVYTDLTDYDEAVTCLEEACGLWEKIYVHGEPNEDFAECLSQLGNVYRQLGLYEKAYQCCHKGLEMLRSLLEGKSGSELELLAEFFFDTGRCCLALEDDETALSYFQRGLKIREEINVDVADTYIEVGDVYSGLERPQQAIEYYEKAILLDEEKSQEHLCSLAGKYVALQEYHKAAVMLEKALGILRRTHSSSAELAETLHNLGITYMNLGRFEESQSHLEEALAIQKLLYGENKAHSETSQTLTNLGYLHANLEHLNEAIDYLKESLNMKYALFGENDSNSSIAQTLGFIGNVYYQREEYENAISYIKQALEKFGDAESPRDHEIALNLCNLAQAYEGLPDMPTALACYEKVLPMMVQVYGESHELTQRVLSSLEEIRRDSALAQIAPPDNSQ